jgi:hypothetical protein
MTSLGTDFEMHAKWQGSVEEPDSKDFVARKVCTIELNKVQGTNCKANKCKERLGSHPEAVVRQATINLFSQLWKSLGDSLPELYCIDLAEAYVTQENVSSRNIVWEEKLWFAIAQWTFAWETFGKRRKGGKKPVLILVQGSHEHLALRKHVMCARNMGAHVQRGTWRTKGIKTWDERSNSCAAEKGAKKLVSSDSAKILEKKVAIKIRETCEKTMFTPSNSIKATNPIVTA